MKLEKINNDKIRAIINISDLSNHNINVHSFMANPLISEKLFSEILDKANKEIGYDTKDFNIKIEILSLSNIDFIITFTKLPIKKYSNKILPQTKTQFLNNKNNNVSNYTMRNNTTIYFFEKLNDFYDFSYLYFKLNLPKHIAKEIVLYEYKSNYFLVITSIYTTNLNCSKINSILTDFATCVQNSDIFCKKLSEHGKIIIKNNALDLINKPNTHFI